MTAAAMQTTETGAEPLAVRLARSLYEAPRSNGQWLVTLPGGELDPDDVRRGIGILATAIYAHTSPVTANAIARAAFDAIGTPWLVTRGEYAGTLPKRLASWFRRNERERFTREVQTAIARIGAELGPAVNHGREYLCDIDRHLDWRAGDFGDSGSCFWGGRANARDALRDDGTCALRLFNVETGTGYARAWVSRVWSANNERDHLVVWNAYGAANVTLARILATALGWSYAKAALSNRGFLTGVIYVNGDCSAIFPHGDAPDAKYDLDIDEPADTCDQCGTEDPGTCGACGGCAGCCGECDECGETRCACGCCPHCETNHWCDSCDRCHDCGRRRGD